MTYLLKDSTNTPQMIKATRDRPLWRAMKLQLPAGIVNTEDDDTNTYPNLCLKWEIATPKSFEL